MSSREASHELTHLLTSFPAVLTAPYRQDAAEAVHFLPHLLDLSCRARQVLGIGEEGRSSPNYLEMGSAGN